MSKEDALSLIEQELQANIPTYAGGKRYYKHALFVYTISAATLSAVTTFCIGAEKMLELHWIGLVALASSCVTTIISAWNSLFGHRERYIQDTTTLMQLYELASEIKYQKALRGSELDEESVERFYRAYEDILRGAHKGWLKTRQSATSSK